jgi:hypothetical protein
VRLPDQAAHVAASARRRVKKTRSEEEEEAAEEDVKKTDQLAFMQENPAEEDGIFNSADSGSIRTALAET